MKTLDRYILRGFVVNYLIALTVMIGLYVVIDLFFNLDEFTKDPDLTSTALVTNILDYYGHHLLLYFAQLAGVITLVAACCTLGRMHRANELTAILATGTSLHRVALPVVVAGVIMNGLWIFDQEIIIPRVAHKLSRTHDDIEGQKYFAVWFLPDRDNALVSALRFYPLTGAVRNLLVIHRDDQGRMTRITRADQATWNRDAGHWALTVGIEERPTDSGGMLTAANLGRSTVDHYDSALTPQDIQIQQAAQWTSFLSLGQLSDVQDRFANDREFVKVKHARITTPIVNMILLLLGIPFFLTRERRSLIVSGGWCLLLCGGCFVLTFFGQNTDFSAVIDNPSIPVWLPVIVFGPVAVYMTQELKT